MFNIILFISTYPVLLIIYFVFRIHEGRMGRAT